MADKILAKKHFDRAFRCYINTNNTRKVIREARAAIEHHPEWSRPHWLLAMVHLNKTPSDREAAIREFREAVRKGPFWSQGHHNLGNYLARQGRIDEAMISLREALRLDPEATHTRVELARCLLKCGDYREAINVLRGKPSLSPHYTVTDAHLLLAETMLKSHHGLQEARAEWEFIQTLDESIPANKVAIGEARKRLAETERR